MALNPVIDVHTENRSISAVTLRSFPYPYKAGFAICSDIDCCTPETFISVHRLINCPKRGLGLPVADSFFGVGKEPGQLAYFLSDGQTPSPHAEMIRHAINAGLIDSIHSWGDFNENPPDPVFLRSLAERLTEVFDTYQLTVKIWINHGNSNNYQNMHCRLNPNYRGDDPASPFYTADLLRKLGIKFYWWSELLQWPLSGDPRRLSPFLWPRLFSFTMKNIVKVLINKKYSIRKTRQLIELALPCLMKDGKNIIGFNRFNTHPDGLWALPTRHTLHHSLNKGILDDLVRSAGYLILYTHLGRPLYTTGEIFPEPDRKALEALARKYHDGEIWVTPTATLLNYWMVRQFVRWKLFGSGQKQIIHIESLDDPTTGSRIPLESELAGLSFYTSSPANTSIHLNGIPLRSTVNPPDHTGIASISLPVSLPPETGILDGKPNV